MKASKRNYNKGRLGCHKKDQKKFWQELGKDFNIWNGGESKQCNAIRKEKGDVLYGLEVVDEMNHYYATMGSNLAKKKIGLETFRVFQVHIW